MGRSRFPGKPLKFQNRKRVSVLSGVVYNDAATESQPPNEGAPANIFSEEKEVNHVCHVFDLINGKLRKNY